MPWLDPSFLEPMYCAPCGRIGIEHVERVKLTSPPILPTPWLRNCPDCYDAGWRLVGDVVAGTWTMRGRKAAAA